MIFQALLISAQLFGGDKKIEIPDWDNAVKFEVVASQDGARPGDSFEVALVCDIEAGYHLYGPEEIEPSRTKVSLVSESLKGAEPVYPPVIRRDLSGLGEYDLYEGKVTIRIPVALPKSHTGDVEASVQVGYQICTDFACSAPASDVFSLKIRGVPAGGSVKPLHSEIFTKK
jgi:hypothetical protein